jgi:tetratricopeptide (TPR) repeat protein
VEAPARQGRRRWLLVGVVALTASAVMTLLVASRFELASHARPEFAQPALAPTPHPSVPVTPDDAWLVPPDGVRRERAARADVRALRAAVEASKASKHIEALALLDKATLGGTPLEPYAEYYRGLSELRIRRVAAAQARLSRLRASLSQGRLRQLVLRAEAEAALGNCDPAGAAALFAEMYPGLTSGRDVILDQWATALRAAGRPREAAQTWLRLYYEFPTSGLAKAAATQADAALGTAARGTRDTFSRDLARAESLIAAGRSADALATLQSILPLATSTEKDQVQLRIAEANCALKRCATQVELLRDLAGRGVGEGEAGYLLTLAYRQAGRTGDFIAQVRQLAAVPAGSAVDPWAERALNELGTHYILTSADAEAAATFKTLFDRNPRGRYAERAAWKHGWRSYRERNYAEAARVFDIAASSIPRANTRPAWI